MCRQRVAVTGLGIVSAVGCSPAAVWAAIEREASGLGALSLFPSQRCGHIPVAEVRGEPADRSGLRSGSRTDHLAACAARDAFAQAALEALPEALRRQVGVVLGTTTGGILDSEVFLERLLAQGELAPELLRHHPPASPAEAVAGALDLVGFRATVSTACASGATAIAVACDALAAGEADAVLAGGADSLSRLTVNGFGSLLNVAADGCRPFDAGRTGLSLGEGAAVLALETEQHARERGAPILAWILGCGSSCDAYHATAPRPDGSGAAAAMRAALAVAQLEPQAVDYVNAHGTGTRDNDLAEGLALRAVFGDRVPAVSSTKRFFGHTLAAAGAIEAVVCILALEHQRVPANLGLRQADPEIGIHPVPHTCDAQVRVALSNSLGFGGSNGSIVLARAS